MKVPRSRDELKETIDKIEDTFATEARVDALSNWLDNTDDRVAELEDEQDELRNRIESLEARIDVVEEGSTSKEGKVRKIVEAAQNYRTGDQPAVVMDAERIQGATGCCSSYAYDLIGDEDEGTGLPQEYHWIITRREARERQFGSAEIDHKAQKKAIVVDFESLESDPAEFHKWNNGLGEEGV